MKRIVTIGLVSSVMVLSLLLGADKENNSSKESNATVKKETKVKKTLEIDLDKFQKKDGSKSGKPNPIKGTLKYNGKNDEVSYYPPQGNNNDEVIYKGNGKICLLGTKHTLFKPNFKLDIIKNGKSISSYPKTHSKRRICVSVEEIKKGDLLLVKDGYKNSAVEMKIERVY
ncbi:MAG TPA: hypothetical protein ENK88_02970 [Campylobacterales bacterium]|nr:hypothetical protein [Campylobacterales bacterium]